jgi:hypothetical protein
MIIMIRYLLFINKNVVQIPLSYLTFNYIHKHIKFVEYNFIRTLSYLDKNIPMALRCSFHQGKFLFFLLNLLLSNFREINSRFSSFT